MSKRKIQSLLKKKGIKAERIEYMRGCPTPSGYASGWDIDISEEVENALYEKGFSDCCSCNEFDTLGDVVEWIEQMPTLGVNV